MSRSVTPVLLAAIVASGACTPPPPPETATAPAEPAQPSFVTVTVRADGAVEINGSIVPQSELDQRFKALAAIDTSVGFSMEKDVSYEQVANVMAAAQRAGLSRKMGVIGGT